MKPNYDLNWSRRIAQNKFGLHRESANPFQTNLLPSHGQIFHTLTTWPDPLSNYPTWNSSSPNSLPSFTSRNPFQSEVFVDYPPQIFVFSISTALHCCWSSTIPILPTRRARYITTTDCFALHCTSRMNCHRYFMPMICREYHPSVSCSPHSMQTSGSQIILS